MMLALQPNGVDQLGDDRITLLVIFALLVLAILPIYLADRARKRRRKDQP